MTYYMVGNLTAFYEAVVATNVGGKKRGGGIGHPVPSPCSDPDIVLWRIVSIFLIALMLPQFHLYFHVLSGPSSS